MAIFHDKETANEENTKLRAQVAVLRAELAEVQLFLSSFGMCLSTFIDHSRRNIRED